MSNRQCASRERLAPEVGLSSASKLNEVLRRDLAQMALLCFCVEAYARRSAEDRAFPIGQEHLSGAISVTLQFRSVRGANPV